MYPEEVQQIMNLDFFPALGGVKYLYLPIGDIGCLFFLNQFILVEDEFASQCCVEVSAIHQHESAVDVHAFLPSEPPSAPSQPSGICLSTGLSSCVIHQLRRYLCCVWQCIYFTALSQCPTL